MPDDATELILVRHGASMPAVPDAPFPLLDGHGDPPLAPEGVAQAEVVARRLAAFEGADAMAIAVSGLTRTVQTAAPLVGLLGREPVELPELREVKLGEWEAGEFRVRMAEGDPLAIRILTEERFDVIPGAEPAEAFARRVRAGVERIVATFGGGARVATFTHGGVIGELCRQATGSRPFAMIHADNCSITRLVVFGDGRWLVRGFNDTSHVGD